MYTATISRRNPACIIFLIDQSASMGEPFGAGDGQSKADALTDVINRFLLQLVYRCTFPNAVRHVCDVGVLGYGVAVEPALGGALVGRELIPINELADSPMRVVSGLRKVPDGQGGLVAEEFNLPIWLDPVARGGTPLCMALRQAYALLEAWIYSHPSSFPPLVINITDGEATDGDPTELAEMLKQLATDDGKVLLCNCFISSYRGQPFLFPASEAGLPDEYSRRLFRMSSVLSTEFRKRALNEGFTVSLQSRGFALNADLMDVIQWLDLQGH